MFSVLVVVGLAGCAGGHVGGSAGPTDGVRGLQQGGDSVAAYVGGVGVTRGEVWGGLVRRGGVGALSEVALDRLLAVRLGELGVEIGEAELQAERARMVAGLNADPAVAERLLADFRREDGLDAAAFVGLLRRNAGLRVLALREGLEPVSDRAVLRAFDVRHGPRRQARLILTRTVGEAESAMRAVREREVEAAREPGGGDPRALGGGGLGGEAFAEVAAERSIDRSSVQGGLLPAISELDPSYAGALREALWRLEGVGSVSRPIVLEEGVAVLRLERELPGDGTVMSAVRGELEAGLRREAEALAMSRVARRLLDEGEIVVLDPALGKVWEGR
ncbi:MAG: hypothetical protein AAF750_07520 [Planctomycetota bacterium]